MNLFWGLFGKWVVFWIELRAWGCLTETTAATQFAQGVSVGLSYRVSLGSFIQWVIGNGSGSISINEKKNGLWKYSNGT